MEFTADNDELCWVAETVLFGRDVKFRLDTEDETEAEADSNGERVFAHVEQNWKLVQGTLVAQLLAVHNEEWADPSCGRPKLSADNFLTKLRPLTIDYGQWQDEDGKHEHCSILFDDSDIFGSHAVLVSWDPSSATIVMNASLAG